jgi:hypothetical protein
MTAQDYTQLITSEHSQQPQFMALVELWTDTIADITDLIDSMPALFDLDQAIGAQLDVLGEWIGLNRAVGGILLVQFFGFSDDTSALAFGELSNPSVGGRFYELGESTTSTAILSDPEYRILLKAKILQNQWNGSAVQFQEALYSVLGISLPIQLVINGDFSNGNTGWFGNGVLDQPPTQVFAVPGSGAPTKTYGDFIYGNTINGNQFAVTAGQQYAVSSYSSATSSAGYPGQIGLELNGTGQPTIFVIAYTIPATAIGWAFYSGLVTIPAGYTLAQAWVGNAGPTDNVVLPDWFHTLISVIQWNPFIFDPGTNCILIAPQNVVDPVLTQLILNYDILPRTAGSRYQFVFPFLPPFNWSVAGTVTASGTTVQKLSGANAWDSAAWIAQPSAKIYMTWTASSGNNAMGGFAVNPATSPSFQTLNYAIYLFLGVLEVYNSGGFVGSFGSYSVGDEFGIYFDGESVVYIKNGIPFYQQTVATTPGPLNPMFSIASPNSSSQLANISIWTGS